MGERQATRPYEFTAQDVQPEKFQAGVEQTLEGFYAWQNDNPDTIAAHVNSFTGHIQDAIATHSLRASLKRRFTPGATRAFRNEEHRRDVSFFSLYNLGEMPDEDKLGRLEHSFTQSPFNIRRFLEGAAREDVPVNIAEVIAERIPGLRGQPELPWLDEQIHRLYRILPEDVIQNGGMGKVARTIAGVLAIGLYDTVDEPLAAQRAHLARILPGAYAYGAMYAVVDDTLQDSDCIPKADKNRYHETILRGIRTGERTADGDLPDHPLAEELQRLQDLLLESFPFDDYRHLYYAGEAMYGAQHRDSTLTAEDVALGGLKSIYPDIFVKASMSRVIANILGRRKVPETFYETAVNINFLNQFRDDLDDHKEDREAGRVTPFSYERPLDRSPLYDFFSYSAYVSHHLFGNDPAAAGMLSSFSAHRLASHFLNDAEHAKELSNLSETTDEMRQFIAQAQALPLRTNRALKRPDFELQDVVAELSRHRRQTDIDLRTFILDRKEYINRVILGQNETGGELDEVIEYALEAGGKRLRPALILMLAEGMGVDYRSVEPLMKTIEFFHTSSLIFDDLPAQDDASLRRGKPTTHKVFGEARAQLAGIAMISSGFGEIAALKEAYPAERVLEVLQYTGSVLGPQGLCRGQDMDLEMTSDATADDILKMYSLKTSTLIEASLVPLMMLEGRPSEEVELVRAYSYHAGVVFQLRDDLLDMTAESKDTGKDANGDVDKINVARTEGIDAAEKLMREHLDSALAACRQLPFNTNLLEATAAHFAARKQ